MDNGPPDPKRARLGSGSWSNGLPLARSVLPPLGPPGSYPPAPPFSRAPAAQAQVVPPPHLDERRHHELEFAVPTPTQEQRPQMRQSFGQPRDPVVKRDQSAEPIQLQYHRPHATGDGSNDGHMNPYPPNDPRPPNMPYDNAHPPPPPPSTQPYRHPPVYSQQPHYTAPNPLYDRQPYEPPPTPGGLREQIQLNIAYASTSGPGFNRRKAPRTSQACDACRAAKAKCDDPKPCSACKEKDIECVWKNPEPKHGDKVQAEILEILRGVWQEQHVLLQKFDATHKKEALQQAKRHQRIKRALIKLKPELEADLWSEEGDEDDVKKEEIYEGMQAPLTMSRRESTPEPLYHAAFSRDSPGRPPSLEEEEEEEAGKAVLPGEPAIPVGHTTGAARLLLWPSVEAFLGEKLREGKKSMEMFVEYPNIQENKHGLRLYGRGPTTSRAHSADASPDDGFSDISTSPSPESVYGQIGGLTPPPNYPANLIIRERRGGLGLDGQLELDEGTVRRLVESYLRHIHMIHPILDPNELHTYARRFVKHLPSDPHARPKPKTVAMEPPGFVGSGGEVPGGKRKRPAVVNVVDLPEPVMPYPLKPGRPQRSIKTALILLVLALGRICEHREKIPDLLPDHEDGPGGSPVVRSGYPSPMLQSPIVSTQSSGLPSPKEGERARNLVRRSSAESFATPRAAHSYLAKNLDVIPGLAYAAFATDIIGNEMGENTLQHVHANILASLYFGQLARPSYSHRHIINASLGLQVILRLKLDRLRKYRPDPENPLHEPEKLPHKDNPLVFAFWTCLQLESDIVAELDLPHSGITTLETHMPWPNLEAAKAAKQLTAVQAESYQAQLYLRNHLNVIHQKVYGVGQMGKSLEEDYKLPIANAQSHFPIIEAMVDSIPTMSRVAPSMVWSGLDPPANDILAARLRAKYYGTENITYRPFLKMVMNRPSWIAKGCREDGPDTVPPEVISPKIMNYSKLCLRALENSTRAFHGMSGGRLIVTNVWGTAHAQWGNVIILQTAYRDPMLRPFIDKDNLRILVVKTLKFLHDVADPASALMTDIKILEFAARKMGFLPEPSSSFSSYGESTPRS